MPEFKLIFFCLVLAAALGDIATRRIPNWLTAGLALAWLVEAFLHFPGWEMLGWHLAAGSAVLFAGFALNALGLMGGGDAKLLAACSLWLGWPKLFAFLLMTALAGGVLALFFIGLRRAARHPLLALPAFQPTAPGIPYGVAIAAAAILTGSGGLTLI